MSFPLSIPLGAPGIYPYPDTPARALSGIRLDVCAFAGIAPRGPVRVPVVDEKWPDNRPCVEPERPRRRSVAIPVESFDEYRRLYGGFEGPGLLPYAVASFFEQGGRRAWIVRIVHDYSNTTDNAAGAATGTLTETQTAAPLFALMARSEGSWGNGLRAAISFTTRPLIFVAATTTQLTLDQSNAIPPGTLLRLTLSNGEQVLRLITTLVNQDHPAAPGFSLLAVLDSAIAGTIDAAEIVEGTLLIDDGDGRRERHERLGFASGHPRWIANVLCYESQLVYPDAGWIDGAIIPTDPILAAGPWSAPFSGGSDRYADIIPQDFFDNQWVLADGEPGDGVHALTQLSDLSLLMVPDPYSPAPLVAQENIIEPVSLAGPDFARCFDLPPVTLQGDRIFDLAGLRLDPKLPDERAKIIALQQQLTALADLLRSFIVLLDVI
jgi:hypothetical protein